MSSGDFVTQTLTSSIGTPVGTTTTTQQLILIATGFSGAAFTVSGTFSAQVAFWASADGGVNWNGLNVLASNGTTPAITTSAPGLFRANISGYTHICATLSSFSSGTPTVSIHCSQLALAGGGGGGGAAAGGVTALTTTGTTGQSTFTSSTGVLNVPNYADISHINLTNTGTTGQATFNTSTGAFNIPNYADISKIVLTHTGTTGASTYNTSTGAFNVPNYSDISHIALTQTGTTGPAAYNTSTGALNIPNYADISQIVLTQTGTTGPAAYTPSTGALNIPNYADISKIAFTATGTSGASTYNTATGALNIPQYGPGDPNFASAVLTADTTTSTAMISLGQGITNFIAHINNVVLVVYIFSMSNNVANMLNTVAVYRSNANVIPVRSVPVGGSDVQVANTRSWTVSAGQTVNLSGTYYDTGLSLNTPYAYYIGYSSGSGSNIFQLGGVILQLSELR